MLFCSLSVSSTMDKHKRNTITKRKEEKKSNTFKTLTPTGEEGLELPDHLYLAKYFKNQVSF